MDKLDKSLERKSCRKLSLVAMDSDISPFRVLNTDLSSKFSIGFMCQTLKYETKIMSSILIAHF